MYGMWKIVYWDGSTLRTVTVNSDYYNLINSIASSPAGPYSYGIISMERIPQ
jgi:hypothetical protein